MWTQVGSTLKRVATVNGHQLTCSVLVEYEYEDCDLDYDFGNDEDNAAYAAQFESGELANLQLRVTARWETAVGTDYLGAVHVKTRSADSDLLKAADWHGMIDNAVEDLVTNIERAVVLYAPLRGDK